MRIIAKCTLNELVAGNPKAAQPIKHWYRVACQARWNSLNEVRKTFGTADDVQVASGRWMLVFNIGGGNFRLVVGRNYELGILSIKRLLTHAEYSKERWKDQL